MLRAIIRARLVAQIINIPLAFKFGPLKAKWRLRTVEIIGWTKDVRKPSLFASIGASDSVTVEILEPGSLGSLSGLLYRMLGPQREYRSLKNPTIFNWSDIP